MGHWWDLARYFRWEDSAPQHDNDMHELWRRCIMLQVEAMIGSISQSRGDSLKYTVLDDHELSLHTTTVPSPMTT